MKEEIRGIVLGMGVDVCGFANISRFEDAPQGYKPTDIFPACKTVIVFGLALSKGLMLVAPRLVYGHFNNDITHRVDAVALEAAKLIENRMGYCAVPVPCDSPYEYWDEEKKEGRGLISMKHAAIYAGLGTIGKNFLFLNRQFGNRLTLGAILIDAGLPSDELSGELCLKGCRKCIEHCPVAAIKEGYVDQSLCRNHTYGKTARGFDTVDCNLCRTVCPMGAGRRLF